MAVKFNCPFKMLQYPFDIQKCLGRIDPRDAFVHLVGNNLTYSGPTNLMEYVIVDEPKFVKDKVLISS